MLQAIDIPPEPILSEACPTSFCRDCGEQSARGSRGRETEDNFQLVALELEDKTRQPKLSDSYSGTSPPRLLAPFVRR